MKKMVSAITNKKWAFAFLLLSFCLLSLRAASPNRWSMWIGGDIQTLLAVKNYVNDGFVKTNFLWIPQQHTSFTWLFDEPELNHHAFGVTNGERRFRVYTHYPSWYSIPYGLIGKLGITNKTFYQMWALMLALTAAYFFSRVLGFYFGETVGLLALPLFVLNPMFLSYSDSLSNLPYDMLFRYLFMFLWIKWNPSINTRQFYVAFFIYFLGCLTSAEIYFFIPLWVALHERFIRSNKIPWLRASTLLGAPAMAMSIQFIQNGSYMGFGSTLKDWTNIVHQVHSPLTEDEILAKTYGYYRALSTPMEQAFFNKGIPVILLLLVVLYYLRKHNLLHFRSLLVLLAPGYAYCLAFAQKAIIDYQGLQVIPFVVGIYALSLTWIWQNRRLKTLAFSALLLFSLGKTYGKGFLRRGDVPPVLQMDKATLRFFDKIEKIEPDPKVYFQLNEIIPEMHAAFPSQVNPFYEYYSNSLILGHTSIESMTRDVAVIVRNGYRDFQPVFVLPNQDDLAAIQPRLEDMGLKIQSIESGPLSGSIAILTKFL